MPGRGPRAVRGRSGHGPDGAPMSVAILSTARAPRRSRRRGRRGGRGVTLIEGLVASIIVAMVAAAGATALTTGVAAQRDAGLQLLAALAAEQQISTIMTAPYADV